MKSSCISHPAKEPLLVIRQWQVEFCEGDFCAAGLLSFFIYWHDVRLAQRIKAKIQNDIAEAHGHERNQDESLFQFHSLDDLQLGLLGMYGKSKISESLRLLVRKRAISIHKNPSGRYKFDRTNFFLLQPTVLSDHLISRHRSVKSSDGAVKSSDGAVKSSDGAVKSSDVHYTETTSETTLETAREREAPLSANRNFQNLEKSATSEKGDEAETWWEGVAVPLWVKHAQQQLGPMTQMRPRGLCGDIVHRDLLKLISDVRNYGHGIDEITRRWENFVRSNLTWYVEKKFPLFAFIRDFDQLDEKREEGQLRGRNGYIPGDRHKSSAVYAAELAEENLKYPIDLNIPDLDF